MKKLIYALVLCLCASGLTVITPSRAQFALADGQESAEADEKAKAAEEEARKKAEEEAAAKKQAEEEAARKKAEEEAAAKKQAEEAAAAQQAEEEAQRQAEEAAETPAPSTEKADATPKAKPEKKAEDKKEDKGPEKPREYTVDLAKNGQFLLSELLAAAKADFVVGDVKAVEPEDEGAAKLMRWASDEQHRDDFVITVLKDFKEARLIVKTKKESVTLVLANGAKYEAPEAAQEVAAQPAEPEEQTEVEKTDSAEPEAEAAQEAVEQGQSPAADAVDTGDLPVETPVEAQAEAAEETLAETADGTLAEGENAGDAGEPDAAAVPEDAEAWFERDGAPTWGTLSEVVGKLEGGETVYIRTTARLLVNGAPLKVLSQVTLAPDAAVLGSGYAIRVSQDNPETVEKPELLETSALGGLGEYANLYIWAEKDGAQSSGDGDAAALTVTVNPVDHLEAAWNTERPQFELSGIPEGKNWNYAALIYNERFVPMADDIYIPTEQGQYTLRFAMQDELGDIMAVSDQYTLWLDWTAPEDVSIEVDEETSYTLTVTARDSVSGVEAVSLNGGRLWHLVGDGETYTYTGKSEKTFEAGEILVRDVAGNIYVSDEEYTVEEAESDDDDGGDDAGGGGGGGSGGGGSGSGAKPLSHASGDGEEGSEYDALLLELPDEAMSQLTVGGEAMDLTLLLESAQAPEAPVGDNQPFTASLRCWNGDDAAPDTLVLDAELDANLGDAFTYEWRFNGEVYRLLANSGVKYVALKVGDDVAAFPTEGFTGGTRYTELKMLGVSTRKFDYTLAMKVNLDPGHVSTMSDSDFSRDCDLSIRAAVEDTNYELSNSPKSIMYFYNVYLGPEAMMDQPFGEYRE